MDTGSQSNHGHAAAPVVALTGFMAVGKSTIGHALATRLRWRFVDLDSEIERHVGLRVQEIFAGHGEEHFRRLETAALQSILADASEPTVIALGGGTFVQAMNAEMLRERGALVVFLELDMELLLQRCRAAAEQNGQNPRPLAADEAGFCALYEKRLPFYRRADLAVNAHGKNAEQVAREITRSLSLSAAPSKT
jgi:shikimate kinase